MAKKQKEVVYNFDASTLDKVEDFKDFFNQFIGQRVAVMAARWQYRGVVSKVLTNAVVLSPAMAVEVSGASDSAAPNTEDTVGPFVCIKFDAIEMVYQPNWVNAPIRGEDN